MKRLIYKSKKSGALTALIVMLILTFVLNLSGKILAERQADKDYIKIEVTAGDTLWDYARQYCNKDYQTYRDFIAEVRYINDIEDDSIYYGKKILIPLYGKNTTYTSKLR